MDNVIIPKELAQMKGIFGCKVVHRTDKCGNEITLFKAKNIFEWACDILFDLHKNPVTRPQTFAALDKISEKIKDAETGEFKVLVERYKSSGEKIDFKEVRKVLAASLSLEFPPRVYSRDANSALDFSLVDDYKNVHLKNMRKSICLEEKSIPLIPNGYDAEVTDNNIKGYVEALYQIAQVYETPVDYEGDREIEIRVQLAAFDMYREKDIPLEGNPATDIEELTNELEELLQAATVEKNVELKEIYLQKLRESVKDKSFEIEIFADFKGRISRQSIEALAAALVEIEALPDVRKEMEASKKKKFEVSIPAAVIEENTDIKIRFNDAYIECRLKHFESSAPVLSM